MTTTTKGYILVTFKITKEDDQYVGNCVELGVASAGDSIEEAIEQIADATELYLNTLEEVGEKGRVLKERGITILASPSADQEVRIPVRTNEIVASRLLPISL